MTIPHIVPVSEPTTAAEIRAAARARAARFAKPNLMRAAAVEPPPAPAPKPAPIATKTEAAQKAQETIKALRTADHPSDPMIQPPPPPEPIFRPIGGALPPPSPLSDEELLRLATPARPEGMSADILLTIEPTRAAVVQRIVAFMARKSGYRAKDITGPSRTRGIVYARQTAIWLSKQLKPSLSLPEIGRRFGGRDHTTILYALRKIDAAVEDQSQLGVSALDCLAEIHMQFTRRPAPDIFEIVDADGHTRVMPVFSGVLPKPADEV